MTYNIYEYDITEIWPIIKEADADIYVLQELDYSAYENRLVDAASWFANELGYFYFEFNNSNTYNGVSILSRWEFLSTNHISLPNQEGHMERSLLIATINSPSGNLTIFASHLQQPFYTDDQVDQIDVIIEYAEQYQSLAFLCDCNTPDLIFHKPYRKLTGYFEDAWIISGRLPGSGRTWPADNPYLRVDYIWVKGDIRVIKDSGQLHGNEENSDHKGVSVEIKVVF
jgi:endonuclease/exonuclease/phosphatase family metal-dependent hydrolase